MEHDALAQLLELLSLGKVVSTALVLLAAWMLIHALQWGMHWLAEHFPRYRLQFAQGYPALRVLIWSLAVGFIILGVIAPPDSIIYAVLGSIGLAVGLGAQDGIRNLLAGLMMIFNPPFRIGDMVRLGSYYGEVTRIDLSVTWLRTFDDNTIMVPNAEVLNSAVANSNSGELSEMVEVPIDLPLGVNLMQARALAEEAAMASPYVFLKKPVMMIVTPRHEYVFLVRLTIKAYVLDVRLERVMASDVAERCLEALAERGLLPRSSDSPAAWTRSGTGRALDEAA